ncbi:MAG: rRNA maturation RNase YbeY [Cyclobacteriaceae bacterium]|nr:rRNA maturation RNase YbeY [Cyclobacteriaceae bacterium]
MAISFFFESINAQLKNIRKRKAWIKQVVNQEGHVVKTLNYIFCDDEYLLEINKQHLQHHFYTDIITFDLSEKEEDIEGDIYVSLDRVKENAVKHSESFNDELDRVLIHGVLHLLGFGDKDDLSTKEMRMKENECLSLRLEM